MSILAFAIFPVPAIWLSQACTALPFVTCVVQLGISVVLWDVFVPSRNIQYHDYAYEFIRDAEKIWFGLVWSYVASLNQPSDFTLQ